MTYAAEGSRRTTGNMSQIHVTSPNIKLQQHGITSYTLPPFEECIQCNNSSNNKCHGHPIAIKHVMACPIGASNPRREQRLNSKFSKHTKTILEVHGWNENNLRCNDGITAGTNTTMPKQLVFKSTTMH